MGGPACEAPVAFDFVCMRGAVVEVLSETMLVERSVTAFVHCGCGLRLQ